MALLKEFVKLRAKRRLREVIIPRHMITTHKLKQNYQSSLYTYGARSTKSVGKKHAGTAWKSTMFWRLTSAVTVPTLPCLWNVYFSNLIGDPFK